MTEYTPTTESVRDCYTYAMHTPAVSRHQIQFDRWLDRVRADEREKIAQAIEAAAYTLTSQDAGAVALSIKRQAAKIARSGNVTDDEGAVRATGEWLNERADKIERGEQP